MNPGHVEIEWVVSCVSDSGLVPPRHCKCKGRRSEDTRARTMWEPPRAPGKRARPSSTSRPGVGSLRTESTDDPDWGSMRLQPTVRRPIIAWGVGNTPTTSIPHPSQSGVRLPSPPSPEFHPPACSPHFHLEWPSPRPRPWLARDKRIAKPGARQFNASVQARARTFARAGQRCRPRGSRSSIMRHTTPGGERRKGRGCSTPVSSHGVMAHFGGPLAAKPLAGHIWSLGLFHRSWHLDEMRVNACPSTVRPRQQTTYPGCNC